MARIAIDKFQAFCRLDCDRVVILHDIEVLGKTYEDLKQHFKDDARVRNAAAHVIRQTLKVVTGKGQRNVKVEAKKLCLLVKLKHVAWAEPLSIQEEDFQRALVNATGQYAGQLKRADIAMGTAAEDNAEEAEVDAGATETKDKIKTTTKTKAEKKGKFDNQVHGAGGDSEDTSTTKTKKQIKTNIKTKANAKVEDKRRPENQTQDGSQAGHKAPTQVAARSGKFLAKVYQI